MSRIRMTHLRALLSSVLAASHVGMLSAVVLESFMPSMYAKGQPLKLQFPWYHTADEIHERIGRLVDNCRGADFVFSQKTETNDMTGEAVALDVVHITGRGASPKIKAMLVFGVHARELISPESGLHFLETLCGDGPDAQRASGVLEAVAFTIVPLANPLSRRMVEDGYYCLRANEDEVDLNRNFGNAHRVPGAHPPRQQNPGPRGFSEPESRILKGLIDEERPDIYISIHSGAYLLGAPWGYTSHRVPENESSIMQLLRPISQKYCGGQCPYGPLARVIQYESPGCDIDYVTESVGTPYAFTWEIYSGPLNRDMYIDEARKLNSQGGSLAEDSSASVDVASHSLTLMRRESGAKKRSKHAVARCMEQFNPETESDTRAVIERWTGAYLELCEEVLARESFAPTSDAESPGATVAEASEAVE